MLHRRNFSIASPYGRGGGVADGEGLLLPLSPAIAGALPKEEPMNKAFYSTTWGGGLCILKATIKTAESTALGGDLFIRAIYRRTSRDLK